MRKIIKLTVFFLIIAVLAVGGYLIYTNFFVEKPSEEPTEPKVDRAVLDAASVFGDYVFEEKIREITGETGEIDLAALANITELDLTFNGSSTDDEHKIKSLTGLKYFPKLTSLTINKNLIYTLDDVSALPELVYFSAEYCMFSDCSALADKTGLTELRLKGNYISDTAFLNGLVNLEYTDVSQNLIEDFSVFTALKFPRLKTLVLSGNKTEELGAVYAIPTLEYLDISYLGLHSLEGIEGLDNLKYLNVSDNLQLTELSAVTGCEMLAELHSDANSLENLDSLIGCDKLEILSLDGNIITDISAITQLPSLKKLYLRNNSISEFASLFLIQLEEYDVDGNYYEQWIKNHPEYAE